MAIYQKYFGLRQPVFSITPDPHYLYLSNQHREALAHLLYGVQEGGGFVLLTGEVGTGKTTICRAFLEQLPKQVDVALVLNPALTAPELLQTVCDEFGIDIPANEISLKVLLNGLNDYLLQAHAKGTRPVLMIDEAQNLAPEVLEQIRMLTNLETHTHKLLQVFLVGQPELRESLERRELRQLAQRITARFHLLPLSAEETRDYVNHRLAVGGAERSLFSKRAIRQVFRLTGGIPRLINILCDRALLGAFATSCSVVDREIVAKASRELRGDQTAPGVLLPIIIGSLFLVIVTFTGWVAYELLEHETLPSVLAFSSSPQIESITREKPPAPVTRGETGRDAPGSLVARAPVESAVESTPPESTEPQQPPPEQKVQAATPDTLLDEAAPSGTDTAINNEIAELAVSDESGGAALPESTESSKPGSEELQLALSSVVADRSTALTRLLNRWNLDYPGKENSDPCVFARTEKLRCRKLTGDWNLMRQYDRPAVIRIEGDSGPLGFVVIHSLGPDYALLDLGDGQSASIPLPWLSRHWAGDFEILWQPPPGGSTLIGNRSARHYIHWLRQTLSLIPGFESGAPSSGEFDEDLQGEILRFQRQYGLALDGRVGPETLIALNNAAALPGIPRLSKAN